MKGYYISLKNCGNKTYTCNRSNAICFLKELQKLCKKVHSALYMNEKNSYMNSVLSYKCDVDIGTHFLIFVHSCKRDVRQHRRCDVANLLPKRSEKGRRYCNSF